MANCKLGRIFTAFLKESWGRLPGAGSPWVPSGGFGTLSCSGGCRTSGDPPHPRTALPGGRGRGAERAVPRSVPGAGLRIGAAGLECFPPPSPALSAGQGQSVPPPPLASPGPSRSRVPAAAAPARAGSPPRQRCRLRVQALTPPAFHF